MESHVFSWSRSRESESVFKTAGVGVGVGFLKLVESESGVGVGFSKLLESESGTTGNSGIRSQVIATFVAITDSNVY